MIFDECATQMLQHQANRLNNWDSSPLIFPLSHASATHYGPPNQCGGHQVNQSS